MLVKIIIKFHDLNMTTENTPVTRTLMPIGVSDFIELIEHRDSNNNGYLFADKTSFIKKVFAGLNVAQIKMKKHDTELKARGIQ